MKTFIAIALAALMSFAAAYMFASNRRGAEHAAEMAAVQADWQKQRQRLEEELQKAKNRTPRVEEVTSEVEVKVAESRDPQQMIDNLIALKPDRETDMTTRQRRIVHEFENLIDLGPAALPAIERFLKLNQEIELGRPPKPPSETMTEKQQIDTVRRAESRDRYEEVRRSTRMKLPDGDFSYPTSLRLGLMEVLYRIGDAEAERILAETLRSAVRGYEVVWMTAWLEKLAEGRYRDLATAVAKDLLRNPVVIPGGSREDKYSKTHLYTVLDHFNDTSFISEARKRLIGPDGKLDQSAVAYLKSSLNENVLPAVLSVYQDTRLTSSTDKARLLGITQHYYGSHPQADELFRTLLTSANDSDKRNKYYAVSGLDGGGYSADGRAAIPKDPQVIQRRLALLESVKNVELDKRTLDMMERTYKNLQKLANGESLSSRGSSRVGR
jgi:hypothetical protein